MPLPAGTTGWGAWGTGGGLRWGPGIEEKMAPRGVEAKEMGPAGASLAPVHLMKLGFAAIGAAIIIIYYYCYYYHYFCHCSPHIFFTYKPNSPALEVSAAQSSPPKISIALFMII